MFVPSTLAPVYYAIFGVYAWRTTCSRGHTRERSHRKSPIDTLTIRPTLGIYRYTIGVETADVEECGSNKGTNTQGAVAVAHADLSFQLLYKATFPSSYA